MNAIHIYEPIGEGFARRFQSQLAAFAGKPVAIRINSPGGSVFEGLTAHQLLKNHGAKVTVYVDGIGASIASIIAMAGDEIRIGPAGMLMIHDASLATRGTARQLTKDAATVEKISDSLAAIYASRSKQPMAKIRDLMLAETWLTATQAIALGFADKLDPGLKAAASAARWNAKDFPGMPQAALAAAGFTTAPASRRETSAELDKLRAENAALRLQLAAAKAEPAPVSALETFNTLPPGERTAFFRANSAEIRRQQRAENSKKSQS